MAPQIEPLAATPAAWIDANAPAAAEQELPGYAEWLDEHTAPPTAAELDAEWLRELAGRE